MPLGFALVGRRRGSGQYKCLSTFPSASAKCGDEGGGGGEEVFDVSYEVTVLTIDSRIFEMFGLPSSSAQGKHDGVAGRSPKYRSPAVVFLFASFLILGFCMEKV